MVDQLMPTRSSTVILHLRERCSCHALMVSLGPVRGISAISVTDTSPSVVTVLFDADQAGICDIVRLIEDAGASVASVTQRVQTPSRPRPRQHRRYRTPVDGSLRRRSR